MKIVSVKEYQIPAFEAITVVCNDFVEDGESLRQYFIQIPHIQTHKARVVKDSFVTPAGKRKIFYIRNADAQPIRVRLAKLTLGI